MFKKIYYINLDHRTDRKEHMEKELAKINFSGPIERVSAAYGKNMPNELIPNTLFTQEAIDATKRKGDINSTTTMTKGGMGVAMSQKWIFEKILTGSEDYALILEDDVNITDDFMAKLEDLLKKIKYYDILWIGYSHNNITKQEEHCDVVEKNWGLFSYIINKKAAKRLIELFPINVQLDSEMYRAFPDLVVYAVKRDNRLITSPPSSFTSKFGTDIQYDREGFENSLINNTFNITPIMIFIIILILISVYCYRKKFTF